MQICFIGGGNMAQAMLGGLLQQGQPAASLSVVEVSPEARETVRKRFGITAIENLQPGAADVFVLAVKPQQLRAIAQQLRPLLKQQLLISIAAGIRCGDVARWLGGYSRIVRVMPNTPALVRAGISGLYALPAVTREEKQQAETILDAVGATLWLEREEQMDAVTAVSGSGPAYVFYFIETLQQAAQELGFDAAQAKQLALATFSGAVKLALEGEDVQVLRSRVTSKGGTTEAALKSMDKDGVKDAIKRAIHAAAERSREIGDELGKAD
ncbi:MAG: pyrroline-5-carboxylate reductase [Burkholderiales bacterium]